MIKHRTNIKVRYGETDQMGYVHHSRYALYLEEARMDLLSSRGLHCDKLEKEGVILPVVEMHHRYSAPLRYGESFVVETTLEWPVKTKLEFTYKLFRMDGSAVSRAQTTLVFAQAESGKLIADPAPFLKPLEKTNNQ